MCGLSFCTFYNLFCCCCCCQPHLTKFKSLYLWQTFYFKEESTGFGFLLTVGLFVIFKPRCYYRNVRPCWRSWKQQTPVSQMTKPWSFLLDWQKSDCWCLFLFSLQPFLALLLYYAWPQNFLAYGKGWSQCIGRVCILCFFFNGIEKHSRTCRKSDLYSAWT